MADFISRDLDVEEVDEGGEFLQGGHGLNYNGRVYY